MSLTLVEEKELALTDRHVLRVLRPGFSSDGLRETQLASLRRFIVNSSDSQEIIRAMVSGLRFVDSLDALPAAQDGVITLNGGAWMLTQFVDLVGNRIEYSSDTVILGTSSETAGITSTGLGAGQALISGGASLPMQNIRITVPAGAKAFNLVATGPLSALDWKAVNVVGGEVGLISGFSNFVMNDSAFLSAFGLVFGGSIGTVAFETVLFSVQGGTMIQVPASVTITRRLRIIYSSFVVPPGSTGLDVSVSASVPVEGHILDAVNFSGGGTYTAGVASTDNKARWENCRGIPNSGQLGHYTMTGNAVATDIITQNVAVKVAGTTTNQAATQKFTHTDNRLTYTGALTRLFRMGASASMTGTSNNVVALYVAKNGSLVGGSANLVTIGAAGRAENAQSQAIVELGTGDFIEAWVANTSANADITVVELSVIADALN